MSQRESVIKAVVYMSYSAVLFVVMGAAVKILAQVPTAEVVVARSLVGSLLGFLLMMARGIKLWPAKWPDLFLRCLFGTVAIAAHFYTIQTMALATAIVLQHLAPLFSILVAAYFGGERPRLVQYGFLFMALSGVLLIEGFDTNVPWFSVLVGIVGAFCSAMAYNFIRKIKDSHHPLLVVSYFALISTLIATPVAIWNWKTPQGADWFWLGLVGVTTFVAQYFMTKAYQGAQISSVAIVAYLGSFLGALSGYFFFGESLGLATITGLVLIVLAVFFNTRSTHVSG